MLEMPNERYWCSWCNDWAEPRTPEQLLAEKERRQGYSDSDMSVASELVKRYLRRATPEDSIEAAEEIAKHFTHV